MSRFVAVLVVLSLASPTVASAQPPPATAEEAMARAKEIYEAGVSAFNMQSYKDAETAFREVYDLIHSPEVLFDIALALEKQRQWGEAAKVYEAYLRDSRKVKDRRHITERVKTLHGRQRRQEETDLALNSGKPAPSEVAAAPGNEVMKMGEVDDGLLTFGEASGVDKSAVTQDATVEKKPIDTATPIYKKWWLWTGVAAVVVIVAVVIIAVEASGSAPAEMTSFPDIGPGAHAPLLRF
jgi:hypothetical protein